MKRKRFFQIAAAGVMIARPLAGSPSPVDVQIDRAVQEAKDGQGESSAAPDTTVESGDHDAGQPSHY